MGLYFLYFYFKGNKRHQAVSILKFSVIEQLVLVSTLLFLTPFNVIFFPFLLFNYHYPVTIFTTGYLVLFSLNSTKSGQTFPFVFLCLFALQTSCELGSGHQQQLESCWVSGVLGTEVCSLWSTRNHHFRKISLWKMDPAAFPHLEISFRDFNPNIFLLDLKWTRQFPGITDFFLQC